MEPLPDRIRDAAHLDDLLSTPTPGVIDVLGQLDGDIVVLGVAGKMGPSLAAMALRAFVAAGVRRRVIGVSRFSSEGVRARLEADGIETIACDLLDPDAVAALPDAPNVVLMAGMKFGSTGQEALTWAMNAHVPALVCRRYSTSRVVAFSTGNVYPLTALASGGARESDAPGPVGEYAMSCLGRERIVEHFSRAHGMPAALLRLNYAVAVRYGVIVDIARAVWEGRPVPLEMGMANVIWQGDANAMALQAFAHAASPPFVVNIAGPEQVSVRRLGQRFGELLGREPRFEGAEGPDALLSNGQVGHGMFGYPRVSLDRMVRWVADWVARGGEDMGKPTHFEARDGRF